MRCLGVDLGDVRTGLALSDPHGITCSPLEVVREPDRERLLQRIMEVVDDNEVTTVVVGLPRPLRGGTNQQSLKVLAFVEALAEASGLPVETWDERFTSRLAKTGRRPGELHDAIAACYILQNFLEAQAERRGDR
jgi:putative Holliday junction resolvase